MTLDRLEARIARAVAAGELPPTVDAHDAARAVEAALTADPPYGVTVVVHVDSAEGGCLLFSPRRRGQWQTLVLPAVVVPLVSLSPASPTMRATVIGGKRVEARAFTSA